MTKLYKSTYWGLLVLGMTIGFAFGTSIGIDFGNRAIVFISTGIGLSVSLVLLVFPEFERLKNENKERIERLEMEK